MTDQHDWTCQRRQELSEVGRVAGEIGFSAAIVITALVLGILPTRI
jgi:hypothetical protein